MCHPALFVGELISDDGCVRLLTEFTAGKQSFLNSYAIYTGAVLKN
jgi:hypothetical protein